MTQTYEAPPAGGDFEKCFDGQSKTFSEDSNKRTEKQHPRNIGEIAVKVFLEICERPILHQIENVSNPTFGGFDRIEAREYLADLLVAYEEAAGCPRSMKVAA